MKLELKHLAPYLPYDLKVYDSYNHDIGLLVGLKSGTIIIKHRIVWDILYDEIEPILRPLSDLTKEIEVNGKKFVPIKKLAMFHLDGEDFNADRIYSFSKKIGNKSVYFANYNTGGDEDDYLLSVSHSTVWCTGYKIMEKLFEWHFDVFGLIEKGLAIDINTIN